MSDNASYFTSNEFVHLCKMNGIKHICNISTVPSTSGMAKGAIQTVSELLKRVTCGTLRPQVTRFICTYRITPQTRTNTSPAELFMKQKSTLAVLTLGNIHRNSIMTSI